MLRIFDVNVRMKLFPSILSILSVLLWAKGLDVLRIYLESEAVLWLALPSAAAFFLMLYLIFVRRILKSEEGSRAYTALISFSLLASFLVFLIDDLFAAGRILSLILHPMGLEFYSGISRSLIGFASSSSVISPLLFLVNYMVLRKRFA